MTLEQNYVTLLTAMQQAAVLCGIEERISTSNGSLADFLAYTIEMGYPPREPYDEFTIVGADVRISADHDGGFHLQLNLGNIWRQQRFYDALWRTIRQDDFPLTMSDEDHQSNNPHPQSYGLDYFDATGLEFYRVGRALRAHDQSTAITTLEYALHKRDLPLGKEKWARLFLAGLYDGSSAVIDKRERGQRHIPIRPELVVPQIYGAQDAHRAQGQEGVWKKLKVLARKYDVTLP